MKLSQKQKHRLQSNYGGWALITGATSGIGKEIAELLASCKLNLIINARNESDLNDLRAEWAEKYDIQVKTIATDLSNTKDYKYLVSQSKMYAIGLAVLSAGFGTSGNLIENPIEEEVNMLRLNCEAVLVLAHEFGNRFKAQNKGGIILLSSLVAFQGTPYAANYAATKAYIQTLAEGLSVELKPHNVDVLAAAPGPVKTNFGNRANMQMDGAENTEMVAKHILNALGKSSTVVPGRMGKFLTYSLRLLPRWGKIKVMQLVMGGMTKHQRT